MTVYQPTTESNPAERETNYTFTLIFSTFVAVLGNSFLYGYNIGVVNTPALIIQEFYRKVYFERAGGNYGNLQDFDKQLISKNLTFENGTLRANQSEIDDLSDKLGVDHALLLEKWEIELLWSTTVAAFVLFGMIGAFTSAKVADFFGRKKGMIVITFVMFIAAIFGGITKVAASPECLIISRIFVGLHSGLNVSLAALYLAEISPKKIRGAIGTCHQLAITVGILSSQILGLNELLGTVDLWPWLFAFNAIPLFIHLVCWPLCPESPRYLLIKKNEEQEATIALRKLRGYDDVEDEIEEMRIESKRSVSGTNFSMHQLLTTPELRFPTVVACLLQVTQQWSGINAVMSYSTFIFGQAQVPTEKIGYVIVGTGSINVLCTVIAVPLMEKLGRRPLLLWPMCMMAISFLLMTVFINLQFNVDLVEHHSTFAMICIVLMHIYVIGFALGLGPIPFILVSEIFRQEPRAAAMSLSTAFNWICNFVLMLAFPFMKDGLGAYTYLLFTIILAAAVVFIFFFVPETKNRTFDEIVASLGLTRGRGPKSSYKFPDEAELQPMGEKV
ncbi:solute carrier family 2, facilitated glucose transporter member 1 isoform X1 [Patella vulgata]|uniref:solute carrier family 2, facilitated glucose transporter member 1 isoform X1 n=1 Tax=Patella vulgata TaxID=6465 RepID=UPI0021805628|nr:solute carrier family 2, facilitated glucose transporter member 1 isoform X1 [Patella vulgata]